MEEDPRKFGLFRHADETVSFAAGSTVFSVGDEARCMYGIKRGKVAVQVAGKTIRTLEAEACEALREMALLNHHTRSASVVALEETELVAVDEPHFLFLVRQNPDLSLQLMRLLWSACATAIRSRPRPAPRRTYDSSIGFMRSLARFLPVLVCLSQLAEAMGPCLSVPEPDRRRRAASFLRVLDLPGGPLGLPLGGHLGRGRPLRRTALHDVEPPERPSSNT